MLLWAAIASAVLWFSELRKLVSRALDAAISLSSVSVVDNALRLIRVRL